MSGDPAVYFTTSEPRNATDKPTKPDDGRNLHPRLAGPDALEVYPPSSPSVGARSRPVAPSENHKTCERITQRRTRPDWTAPAVQCRPMLRSGSQDKGARCGL